jgi:hypothetical protein
MEHELHRRIDIDVASVKPRPEFNEFRFEFLPHARLLDARHVEHPMHRPIPAHHRFETLLVLPCIHYR